MGKERFMLQKSCDWTIVDITTETGVEKAYTVPEGVTKFLMQARPSNDIQIAVVAGQSNVTFYTMKSGSSINEDMMDLQGKTLYFYQTSGGQVIIEFWYYTRGGDV